ncbi:hypothetical protein L6164_012181 [Bauhinia variegata]|uniref:Uncharacterized protein n=1 Tax=Bauhinia variegata TaxID=167791 RepID=A0ACB9P9K1_BAUVA|nr:hypothetical protein L6164_012181 [Bauhinia variegata]
MSDGSGFIQFMGALSEIANGACEPSVPPVWCRKLLSARDPPRITCTHNEYEQVPNAMETLIPLDNMINCSFFFGPNEVAAIRQLVPSHLRQSSTFVILTACLWRCRTIALQFDPNNEVRIIFPVNVNSRLNPKLPLGTLISWNYKKTFLVFKSLVEAEYKAMSSIVFACERFHRQNLCT